MTKWIVIAAVLLALVGGVVWAAAVNSGWYAAGPMHDQRTMTQGGCQAGAGTSPDAVGDAPAACHGAPAEGPHAQGAAQRGGCHMNRGEDAH